MIWRVLPQFDYAMQQVMAGKTRAAMRLSTLLWAACSGLWLAGCASPPAKPVVPLADIPAQVAAEFQQSVAGWNAGSLETFLAIYAESATFALADGFLQGKSAIRDFYAANFKPGAARPHLTLERLDVEVLSPDAVLVRGIYQNSFNGQPGRRGTTTLVLRRLLDHWRIIHDHSS
jgi:uncharacterized protein (TIGR02246 family)